MEVGQEQRARVPERDDAEAWDFAVEVTRCGPDAITWRVEVWEGGGFRAATEAGDLDTALRMAVPYLASSCQPGPLEGIYARMARDRLRESDS